MDGKVVIGTELDTKSFEAQIKQLESKLELLEKSADESKIPEKFRRSADEARELNAEIEKTRNQLSGLYEKQAKLNNAGFTNMKQSVDKVGNSINGVIKKVSKWALAVFSVRSAYLFVRSAVSTLSQYDDQLAVNIEYIRYLLASVLKPVIEGIVNLAYKLLVYINYIAQAWFGINLFANASTEAFQKQQSAMKGTNKQAKELQKTLAGFDEMNILQDTGATTRGGGGGGVSLPSFADMGQVEIPEWVKWIANNKDLILTVLGTLAATFAATKVAGWIKNLSGLASALGNSPTGILGLLGKIALIGAGIVITITIAKKIWDEAQQLKKEIDKINEAGKKGQKEWLKNEEDIDTIIRTQNVNRGNANKLLEQTNNWLYKIFGWDKKNLETARYTSDNINEQIKREIELYKKKINTEGKTEDNLKLEQQIKDSIYEQYLWNLQIIDALKQAGMDTGEIERNNRILLENYQDMGGKVNYVKDELGNINAIQFDEKVMKVDVKVNTSGIAKQIETAFKGKKLKMTTYADGEVKIDYMAKGGIVVPKLARGGILNMPGSGVPVGSAFAGERGAEGVIPLTDSQQMALLGEAIGKYISVNLTNITELDGRQIARKVEQINQNNNFVLNR